MRGPSDLPKFTVATVTQSIAQTYLDHNRGHTLVCDDLDGVLAAVAAGQAAAGFYDASILSYRLREHPQLRLLPVTFERQDYALALPLQSPLRKSINIALLEFIQSEAGRARVKRDLGEI